MAARITTRQADKVKSAIQTGLIVKRLQEHMLGDLQLTRSQIDAAKILLGKTMPDLAKTTLTGEEGGPIQIERTIKLVG
jgi:hypothetical protein